MASVSSLSDAELRAELSALGATVGPITATTRSLYEKQLEKRRRSSALPASSPVSPRSPSKSPVRVKRKSTTMTSSTEVVTDLARHPSDRRKSLQSGGGRHKGTRSEPEDTSDSEERESAFQNEELMPELRVLRGRTAAVPQAPSSDKKSPQASPSKKRADEIYPGLLNITAPMLAPKTAPAPQAPSKISQRTPTPPRFSSIHRVEPPSSYSTSSSIFKSTPTAPSTTGAVTDLTTLYLSQSRDRPAFTATRDPFGTGRRIVQQEEQEEYEDEEMEDEDDGHMESSRELPSSGFTNHYLLPAPPRSSVKRVSILAAISKIPSRAIAALTAPFKSSPKSVGHYDRRQTYGLGGAYAGAARGRSDISARGVDVSRLLLYSLTLLFAFLLLAYLATVHTQIFINAGRIASNAAMETAIFLYAYAILPTIIIAIIISVCMGAYFVNQRWHAAQAEEKRAVFDLIEKITDIIRDSSEQGQAYVAEPHVRDMLIPPSKRLRDSPEWRRWQQAVSFINLNESRVSTESRIINGVECAVWRWLPAKKTGWQGNAFDGQSQLNVPDHALSHCLKLRGMFPSTQSADRDGADVKRALLQKLSPIRPLHVHVEEGSKEGVVFARFATFSDCKDAFTALHGTWFNGQLVSAKYLRDERYEQRFPDAKRQ